MASTKAQIKRSRLLADALKSEAMSTAPVGHWTQGLARVLDGAVAGIHDRRADNLEDDRSQMLARALGGDMNPNEMENFGVVNDMPELLDIAGNRRSQANTDRQYDYNVNRDKTQDNQWQQSFTADQGWKSKDYGLQQGQFGLEREKFDWQKSKPADPTSDMQEYQYSQTNPGFVQYQQDLKRAGATNITNTVGSDEGALKKKLAEKEGESWSGLLESGTRSAGVVQDLDVLDELLKMAPQGPITGRLVQAFPGFSSSGDAANSIMKRVAPSLRQPGSGSTSDIEYDGLLKSMPNLVNTPGGNQIISQTMRAKAQLDVERGQIVSAYQNGTMPEEVARTKLQELNSRSIMTPEMKQLIFGNAQPNGGTDQSGYSLDAVEQELRRRGQ